MFQFSAIVMTVHETSQKSDPYFSPIKHRRQNLTNSSFFSSSPFEFNPLPGNLCPCRKPCHQSQALRNPNQPRLLIHRKIPSSPWGLLVYYTVNGKDPKVRTFSPIKKPPKTAQCTTALCLWKKDPKPKTLNCFDVYSVQKKEFGQQVVIWALHNGSKLVTNQWVIRYICLIGTSSNNFKKVHMHQY